MRLGVIMTKTYYGEPVKRINSKKKVFKNNLSEIMEKHNLTNSSLAKIINRNHSAVSEVENDK